MRTATAQHRRHACLAAVLGTVALASTLVGGGAGAASAQEHPHNPDSTLPGVLAPEASERRVVIESVTTPTIGRGGPSGNVVATLRNPGSSAATDVTVSYTVPTHTSVVTTQLDDHCSPRTPAAAILDCSLASLAAGASATITIPVRTTDADVPLGATSGTFSAPRTSGWDPLAGEVLVRSWDLEAGHQGETLQNCWPIERPSPNMDVVGTPVHDCDGVVDSPASAPSAATVHTSAPPPFSERVTRSWEWLATYTPTVSGTHHVCGALFDDGGYVALAPDGREVTSADVVVDIPNYASGSDTITLTAGTTYQVVVRISNRGPAGVNNGGNNPGGWSGVEITPSPNCDPANPTAFGINAAGVMSTDSPVQIVGLADLGIHSALSGNIPGTSDRITSALISNHGPDSAAPVVSLDAGAGNRVTPTGQGCLISNNGQTAKCAVGELATDDLTRVTHRVPQSSTHRWTTEWLGGIDPDTSNNTVTFHLNPT